MKKTANNSGFTLIELLIVFAVIAVLTTLAALNIQGQLLKVRDAKRKSDLKEIKNAVALFYNAQGAYPRDDVQAQIHYIFACGGAMTSDCTWGQQWTYNGTTYMNVLPADPINIYPQAYGYRKLDTDNFLLWTVLEYKTDSQATTSRSNCNYVFNLANVHAQGWGSYTALTGVDPAQQPGLYVVCP